MGTSLSQTNYGVSLPDRDYRRDIDGLRGLAVILVIAFHCGVPGLSGGFVGVDVFFVISGYLITSIIVREREGGTFSLQQFYKRRIARLVPALLITLFGTLAFAFLFYSNPEFDRLGKVTLFSAFGAANILFAKGVDYFAQEESAQPLAHLWSLGVEEQFYLIWPTALGALLYVRPSRRLPLLLAIWLVALVVSESGAHQKTPSSYFLPQFRAFELLTGAVVSMAGAAESGHVRGSGGAQWLPFLGLTLIGGSAVSLSDQSTFPGTNALLPCIGSALTIRYASGTLLERVLGHRLLVWIGLISYPLYLYHQPILSGFRYLEVFDSNLGYTLAAFLVPLGPAWLTQRFVERPLRTLVKGPNGRWPVFALVAVLVLFGVTGLAIAKANGLPNRMARLNPYAFEISEKSAPTFQQFHKQGLVLRHSAQVLFVGDSLVQHYVHPISEALALHPHDVSTATRGGCVLLKGVSFSDTFADISCDALRNALYAQRSRYRLVFISQNWRSYESDLLNAEPGAGVIDRWLPFLEQTVLHFRELGARVYIIGPHLEVSGTKALQPNTLLTRRLYEENLDRLRVVNRDQLRADRLVFKAFSENLKGVRMVFPEDIWCTPTCKLHNGSTAFFLDGTHATAASTPWLKGRIKDATFLSY